MSNANKNRSRGRGPGKLDSNGVGSTNEIWRIAERMLQPPRRRRVPPSITLATLKFQKKPAL